jgi:glycosyltransferase involved in cell wall biosynthesis
MNRSVSLPSRKSSITWVTPDYFVDCDSNPEIWSGILEHFNVHWIILLPHTNARFSEKDFVELNQLPGLTIEIIHWNHRARSPKMLFFYEKVYNRIQAIRSELVYFNYVPTSPYVLPLYWRLNKSRTVVTAHDGSVKPSFSMPWLAKIVFALSFKTVHYVNMFSDSQAALFRSTFTRSKIYITPLGLKDFGKSTVGKRNDDIVFLFFGSIHSNKNIELLIDAGCKLYERGVRGFKISINGSCSDWERYKAHIKYPEIFECNIRFHQNSEIPDLCASSHYMLFPYKEMSQSGALKVAFQYNLPVITSDLPGFTDEVKDHVNGFIFESENLEDLERVLLGRIEKHEAEYEALQQKIVQYNQENYAPEVLAGKYVDMFDNVLLELEKN